MTGWEEGKKKKEEEEVGFVTYRGRRLERRRFELLIYQAKTKSLLTTILVYSTKVLRFCGVLIATSNRGGCESDVGT